MEIVLLIARVFLASIFALAGLTKAVDLARSRRTLVAFGVPEKLAGVAGTGLPFIEILVAVALLPIISAWWGAVAALALMLAFAAGIGVNLARGQRPDCNCFGQIHSKPVSWSTFARNLALAAVAGVIVSEGRDNPGLSAFDWMAGLKSAEIAGLAIGLVGVGLLAVALVYLRRILDQQATVLGRIEEMKRAIDEDYAEPAPIERSDATAPVEGLPVGAPAPSFSLPAISGEQMSLDDLLAFDKPVLLLFVSPNCFPCKSLLSVVRAWDRDYSEHLTIALLSKGTVKENQDRIAQYGARHLLLQGNTTVAEDYYSKWTPAAVLIGREGKIASQMTYGDEAIKALVNHAVTTGVGRAAEIGSNGNIPHLTLGSSLFKVGEPAPRFSLLDLKGSRVSTVDLLGKETLLLFWDSECRYCMAMSGDIVEWEEKPPKDAPRLVIIASGNEDKVRAKAKDFTSPVLLDSEFDIAPMYGSKSTPSAVLIDGEGRIASSLAVGARNVLALAGVRKVELPIASIA
jgi:peroxiredoxin/uncharacterized membrane protein YphA (DoxX/SURF4 family)